MRATAVKTLFIFCLCGLSLGCETTPTTDLNVERLPEVNPTLPPVPTLPPPPHPVTLADSSYTIYGLRRRLSSTIDNENAVTGYIVDIYQPPECESRRGQPPCPPPTAPHMWIADVRGESDRGKQLQVVGYAENQESIDEVLELVARGRYEPPDPETGQIPIPTDLAVGNKVKVTGRFVRVSGIGFNSSEGLLEYRGHETLEAVNAEE